MEQLLDYINRVQSYDIVTISTLSVSALLGTATLAVIVYYGMKKLMGNIIMRKKQREHLRLKEAISSVIDEAFKEIIEDRFVCQISKAISDGRIKLDDAREIHSHYARMGFWGLHPRKLNIIPSRLEQQLLKEKLMLKHRPERVLVNPEKRSVETFLEGVVLN